MATGMSKTIGGTPQERDYLVDEIEYLVMNSEFYCNSNCAPEIGKLFSDHETILVKNVKDNSGIFTLGGNIYHVRYAYYGDDVSIDPHKYPKFLLRFLKKLYNKICVSDHYEIRYFDLVAVTDLFLVTEYIDKPITVQSALLRAKKDGSTSNHDKIYQGYNNLKNNFEKYFHEIDIRGMKKGDCDSKTISYKKGIYTYKILDDFGKKNILFDGFSIEGKPKFILMDIVAVL